MEEQTSDNAIITTHKLDFESADSPYNILGIGEHKLFRIGTCTGQWGSAKGCFYILSVINHEEGNGHLEDVFEWFEFACKESKRNLLVLACFNERFYRHLLWHRGFIPLDAEGENLIKVFNKKAYRQLKKHGNEIIIPGTLKCI